MYQKLKHLYPQYACREHMRALRVLEKEGLYHENEIPQLDDVSNFLKSKPMLLFIIKLL